MSRNRRKHPRPLQVGTTASISVVLVLVGVLALSWVFLKVQLHTTGGQIKALEQELADLETQNAVLAARITALSSRNTLRRRLEQGIIKMTPITANHIVRWNTMASLAVDGVRPAANEGFSE